MTVPSRSAAARLLLTLDPPPWHVRHARAVAEIAGWLAWRIERQHDVPVDRGLAEAAGLLHDIDKALPPDERRGLPHGHAGAAWLDDHGYGELAEAVRLHPVPRLADAAQAEAVRRASLEARIVAYADKRAGQRLEPMSSRFAGWRKRYPEGWSREQQALAWQNALALEADVCARAGCPPRDVGRLRWTAQAFVGAGRPT